MWLRKLGEISGAAKEAGEINSVARKAWADTVLAKKLGV